MGAMKAKAPKGTAKRKSMQEKGYKALTAFVKLATYHAMTRRTKDANLSHSLYVRQLIEADLERTGYLVRSVLPPNPPSAPK